MNRQIEISFETKSPINIDKLNRQNKLIYEYLIKGNKINRYLADQLFGIGNLHSRIPELKKELKNFGLEIQSKFISVNDRFQNKTTVKEYWID